MPRWGANPEIHACRVKTLPTERHSYPWPPCFHILTPEPLLGKYEYIQEYEE